MRRSRFSLIKPFSLRENTNFSGRNILQKHRNPGSCKYYYMDGSDSPNLPILNNDYPSKIYDSGQYCPKF